MLSATNIQNVASRAEIDSLLSVNQPSSAAQYDFARPVSGVEARPNGRDGAWHATKKQAFPEEAPEHLQRNANGTFPSNKGCHMTRKLANVAGRAVLLGFITLWFGVWTLLYLTVYAGLPFILA